MEPRTRQGRAGAALASRVQSAGGARHLASASDGDYGVSVEGRQRARGSPDPGSEVTIWGKPEIRPRPLARLGLHPRWATSTTKCRACLTTSQPLKYPFPDPAHLLHGPAEECGRRPSWPLSPGPEAGSRSSTLAGPSTEAHLTGFEDCGQLPFEPSLKLTKPQKPQPPPPPALQSTCTSPSLRP